MPTGAPSRRPLCSLVGAALLALAASGCSSTVQTYPDRSTPLQTYQTFIRAWREGDLAVLEATYSQTPLKEFERAREEKGDDGLAEWYRRDAQLVEFGEPDVEEVPPMLASVTVPVLDRRGVPREKVFRFHLVRAGGEWKLFRIRTRPVDEKQEEEG